MMSKRTGWAIGRGHAGRAPALRGLRARALPAVVVLLWAVALAAQDLPGGSTPRGLVFAFLNETASTMDSVNRAAFRARLAGDMAHADPRSFKGMLSPDARFRIDTIPELPSAPGARRVLAYVTVDMGGERENWYCYCVGDTIWRLEALCRFPTALERQQIRQSLASLDTANPRQRQTSAEFRRMLLPDDTLRAMLRRSRADAEKLLGQLSRGSAWTGFDVRDVDFGAMEEYRELDDDVDSTDLIFYTADRGAIERLKRMLGVRRIERSDRYPDLTFLACGTMQNASYGYIYAPRNAALPDLSPHGFFMLKQAAEGWWLYKRSQ